jgi:hypothetical protein
MSLPRSLQNLQALPLRAIDDKSLFPQGRFIVSASPSKDEKIPLVVGKGSDVVAKTWFKTPVCARNVLRLRHGTDGFHTG